MDFANSAPERFQTGFISLITLIQDLEEDFATVGVLCIGQSIIIGQGLAESGSRVEGQGVIILISNGVSDGLAVGIIDEIRLSEEDSTNTTLESETMQAPSRFVFVLLAVLPALPPRRSLELSRVLLLGRGGGGGLILCWHGTEWQKKCKLAAERLEVSVELKIVKEK